MDFVLLHSSEERKLIEKLLSGLTVQRLDVWSELGRGEKIGRYCEREPDSVAFWGAMDRQEHIDAATYAAEKLLPRIWSRRPQVSYCVAGNRPITDVFAVPVTLAVNCWVWPPGTDTLVGTNSNVYRLRLRHYADNG